MSFLDATLHIANFFAPALFTGLIAATLTSVLWRRELATVSWSRLAVWAVVACTAALVGGLLLEGRDGTMSSYAAMVVASAIAIWWAAFGSRGRKQG